MDPVALIVGALATAVANLAEPAVKDAYNGLKALIKRKFSGNSDVELPLEKLEKNPEGWKTALESSLNELDAGKDPEIVAAAEQLRSLLEARGVSVSVSVSGGGIAAGGNINISGGKVAGRDQVEHAPPKRKED